MRTSRREPAPQASQVQASQLKTSQRGQALPIFVASVILFIGLMAVVADVSWFWVNSLRVQRAADAAALAGVVWLPGAPSPGASSALAESAKNGYTNGLGGVTITANPDPVNNRRMNVTISAPVPTFFMRYFGIATLTATRKAKAEFVLPVPMGSPQNYYGVFGKLRTPAVGDVEPNLAGPPARGSPVLNPQGFWGTMHLQGSEDVNGDAFLPNYETRTSTLNAPGYNGNGYNPTTYYNYGVEMVTGASNGEVWIFDPVFCATNGNGQYGTGDRWFSGSAAASAWFELWDTNNTPYDQTDDGLVATSGTLFEMIRASDPTLNGPAASGGILNCSSPGSYGDGRDYHNRWWQLASGLQAGHTYRLKTISTGPNQLSADGQNSFAFWATATGTAPRIYGLGTMEAYTPLNGGGAAVFYFSQIDAVHAGKTLEIKLWDPGDTGSLDAFLRVLRPCESTESCPAGATAPAGYTPVNFTWTSVWGTSNSARSSCNSTSSSGTVTTVQTSNGGSQVFNGCWLTILTPIPKTYTAPTPAGEPGPGWWKMQYNMGGSASSAAYDLTTWQVNIRGNPVHLVVP